ncbi:MAG: hypothetical protein J0L92_38760, partial [Deltaproteobacteria bacterium]|nr:hypothetical protein [Deltaproteobacteria bacterium]
MRVQSGLRAGDELRHVRAFVFRGSSCVDAVEIGAGALPLERDDQSALGVGTLTVAEVGPLEPGVYAVQLVGRRPGATGAESGAVLLERCVVTSISNDRVLRIALTTACVGVTCPAAGGSEAFTECLNGQCVDPRCDPTRPETAPFCCDRDRLGDACDADPSVCRDDDDCDVIADCAGAPRCSEGACIEAEDDRCDEAQHCDVAMRACVPDDPSVDADAGLLDARAETLDAGGDEVDAPLDMDASSTPLDAAIA